MLSVLSLLSAVGYFARPLLEQYRVLNLNRIEQADISGCTIVKVTQLLFSADLSKNMFDHVGAIELTDLKNRVESQISDRKNRGEDPPPEINLLMFSLERSIETMALASTPLGGESSS